MQVSKNYNNYSYIHDDYDKDGVPNIDDEYPFDPKRKQKVNKEVSLNKLFSYLDVKRNRATTAGTKIAEKTGATSFRVKDNYSTINKLVRRNPFVSNDFIGLRFETEKRREARQKWIAFNKQQNVPSWSKKKFVGGEIIASENKYRTNSRKSNLYRAYHSNILLPKGKNTFGFEAQFRTKSYGLLNDEMHKAYKQGKKVNPEHKRRSKKLLRKGE